MELTLPHVIVRVCRPGLGGTIVSALGIHPVDVSEARDVHESRRVAARRPALLVVLVEPTDGQRDVGETWSAFPAVPILLVSDAPEPALPSGVAAGGRVDSIPSSLPLQTICWHVMEAVSRAAVAEHPLGPVAFDVDSTGTVLSEPKLPDGLLIDGRHLQAGQSLLPLVHPADRGVFTRTLEMDHGDDAHFAVVRLLTPRGAEHAVTVGVRRMGTGRVALLVQPLISGSPIVGRHINDRDPVTGLLTRWAMSPILERVEHDRPDAVATLLILRLDDAVAIADYLESVQTDLLLVRMAAAMTRVLPDRAVVSRIMGGTFLALLPEVDAIGAARLAEQLTLALEAIEVPRFAADFSIRSSIGIAAVEGQDADLAMRLAEAATAESQAAGGGRAVVAGSAGFTREQAGELTSCMNLGAWEVWLQPVAGDPAARPQFHEALARFDIGQHHMASRADFFIAGRAAGLLERFDTMMLQRTLEILDAQRDARLSVNVSYETFASPSFPATFLDLVREVPSAAARIILEIAPRCMAAPTEIVRSRLCALAAAGIAVALDDFGSGICRLEFLTQLPLAIVKLDEIVTGYVDDDPLQREFVRTVVSICRARGITTVAEYTRRPEQLTRLVEDGVDLFQGELFGMPRPAAEVIPPAAAGTAPGANRRQRHSPSDVSTGVASRVE